MLLNLFFDVILILILVFGSYVGYTRGFFRMVARPMRFVLCLSLSFALCVPFGESFISPIIKAPIANYIEELLYDKCIGLSSEAIESEMPTLIRIAAVIFDLPADMTTDTADETADATVERIISSLTIPAVNLISTFLAFLILSLLCRLTFNFLVDLADGILSIGVIGSMNRFFGALLSCGIAFIAAWLVAQGIDLLLRTPVLTESEIAGDFGGGPIYLFFISFSPLRLLLSF